MQKLKLFTLVILLSGWVHAQEKSTFNFAIDHTALSVKNVARSAEFYKSVLGLPEITNRSKLEGVRWFSLSEGKELHLISILKEPVTTNKAVHLALTTSRFDAFVARLDKLNISYSDWPGTDHKVNIRADGIKQIFFRDPDGYWIEVNSVAKK
jgi:lactoylglutathione lyase